MTPARISIVPSALDPTTTDSTLADILEGIGNGRWQSQVSAVRTAYAKGGKSAADAPKRLLPGALFSGTFTRRASDALQEHSGLICVDLDHLGPQLEGIRDLVASDEHTLAAFISPTGTGLKVIFRCDPARPHIESYRAAERYVLERFGLQIDTACKDVSRICFVSHDPDIMVAESAVPLPYPPPQQEFKAPAERMPTARLLAGTTPGDDYDQRGDVPSLLLSHGWTRVGRHGWRRPGKESGISATWDHVPGRLYVFSSSTAFTPNHVYRGWHVYAMLEHGGDFSRAARALGELGFGEQRNGHHTPLPTPAVHCDMTVDDDGPISPAPTPKVAPRPITDFSYPTSDDPNILLGEDDYLGRGGGMLFVSHAGAGKSSWIMDACMTWALGLPWMGIRCARPLRSLIIQAEDSDRYIGKIFTSFAHVHDLSSTKRTQLSQKCHIVRLKGVAGPQFFDELRRLTTDFAPDLVIINPIYLYAQGDIGRSEFTQPFLLSLDAVNKDEKFAYILVHHTGKPAARDKTGARPNIDDWESAYMGFGSSYLANWPRCTALLEPVPGDDRGRFLIKLGKGGLNAGVMATKEHDGVLRKERTTRIPIRHSTEKMIVNDIERPVYYWVTDDAPQPDPEPAGSRGKGGRKPTHDFSEIKDYVPKATDRPQSLSAIFNKVRQESSIPRNSLRDLLVRLAKEGTLERVLDPALGPCYRLASLV